MTKQDMKKGWELRRTYDEYLENVNGYAISLEEARNYSLDNPHILAHVKCLFQDSQRYLQINECYQKARELEEIVEISSEDSEVEGSWDWVLDERNRLRKTLKKFMGDRT